MPMFGYSTGDIEKDAEIYFAEEERDINESADEQQELLEDEFGEI